MRDMSAVRSKCACAKPNFRPVVALLSLVLAVSAGCASTRYVTASKMPRNPFVDPLRVAADNDQPSPRTLQVLRSCALLDELDQPEQLLKDLQQTIDREPTAEKIYAFAEMGYRAGRQVEARDPKAALDFYGASVAHSYRYLFDEKFSYLRNPYDPQFRGACDLYNGSLEAALRIVSKNNALRPGQHLTIETATRSFEMMVVLKGSQWHENDFDRFEFVSDYQVQGLNNQYQTYGLGVPLIAIQRHHEHPDVYERYYPPGLSFPVTAFLRPLPKDENSDKPHHHRAVLELHDPLATTDVAIGPRVVPLESDLSTPLAYFLQTASTQSEGKQVSLEQLSTFGLLRPDKTDAARGLYMLQPYEPDKIPVVLVHGLWSSPLTWTDMFNDLRAHPSIRNRFQFWFYFYPTGQPFWNSATQFRRDLAAMREQLDPQRQQPALDQMVLVGHSMGGLVSRLQSLKSGDDFWHIASDRPFDELKADVETKQKLRELFYFEPNPSVKRVVTIGTPHRGSVVASNGVQYLSHKLISLPKMMFPESVIRDNRDLLKNTFLLDYKTSIDSLSPAAPIFPVMITAQHAPWVTYHNIVGVVPDKGVYGVLTNKVQKNSDGVVSYESAHMTDVASEIVVPEYHQQIHSHPRSVLEVRRILLEHLAAVQSQLPATTMPLQPLYSSAE